jgi:hypothetical protein
METKDNQKMKRSPLSVAFDILGILNLIAAAAFLAMFFWGVTPASQGLALKGFTPAFSMTLLFFALGRLTELFELVHVDPIIERRGRESSDAQTPEAPVEATMDAKSPPQPLKLHLVEPSETAPEKTRRDAA